MFLPQKLRLKPCWMILSTKARVYTKALVRAVEEPASLEARRHPIHRRRRVAALPRQNTLPEDREDAPLFLVLHAQHLDHLYAAASQRAQESGFHFCMLSTRVNRN